MKAETEQLTEQLERYAEEQYCKRLAYFGWERQRIQETVDQMGRGEAVLLKFLLGTLPLSDVGDCDISVLREYCSHSWKLRQEAAWCRDLPEHLFLHFVLYPRVNSEPIEDCRGFFYEQIKERIRGLSLEEAVLEINYWCGEQVEYQASDDRTASPLTVYRFGKGRCGEESTFVVSVLRSAGIAARQVYVPRWAHCDDNHAWVEVWIQGQWHFLGACEPEEVLDRGWFTNAASRAVMVHTGIFSDYEGEKLGEWTGSDGIRNYYNRTPAYGKTGRMSLTVLDEKNCPVEGASVSVELLNMAEYSRVAEIFTDQQGRASLALGLGSVYLSVEKDGKVWEQWVTMEENLDKTVILREPEGKGRETAMEIHVEAPADGLVAAAPLTVEQKKRNQMRLRRGGELRRRKEEDGNREAEVRAFLETDANPLRRQFLSSLSDKDFRDGRAEIWEDHLRHALPFAEDYPEELFVSHVLCPRIGLEKITPYRSFIRQYFDGETLERFAEDPISIWNWVKKEVRDMPQWQYGAICFTPLASLKLRSGDETSKKILFAAICRTVGVAAGIRKLDGKAWYFDRTSRSCVTVEEENPSSVGRLKPVGRLKLSASDDTVWRYRQNWSIGKWVHGRFETLSGMESSWKGDGPELSLEAGTYRILTVSRMPNGSQNLWQREIKLDAGACLEVNLHLVQGDMRDMLMANPIADFELWDGRGTLVKASSLMKEGAAILAFLEEGREPTEHVLNEMLEHQERIRQPSAQVVFVVQSPKSLEHETLRKALESMPDIQVFFASCDGGGSSAGQLAEPLARRMYVDPDKLPLLIAMKDGMVGIYGCSGYRVGSVDLIWRLLAHK